MTDIQAVKSEITAKARNTEQLNLHVKQDKHNILLEIVALDRIHKNDILVRMMTRRMSWNTDIAETDGTRQNRRDHSPCKG